ncbi:MAG: homoserine O-acetyltransferase [Acidobacteriota bacterium]|nr:homoserine O-acetyltransferase [Acidobacteriota bacterium]
MAPNAISNLLEPAHEGDFTIAIDQPFQLFSGGLLQPVMLHYAIYGKLNERRNNAILICHALSGSARAGDWWPQLFLTPDNPDGVFDLSRDCVICVNVIGSCYGSTGPGTINAATGEPFGADFPLVTVRDWVRSQGLLLDHLGIERLHAVVGGSIGGMQAIQWAIDFPHRAPRCVAIGAAPLTAMGLALNHLQRQVILNNANDGLGTARAIAMLSYKSEKLFEERFARQPNRNGEDPLLSLKDRYDIGGYLDYQGEIFARRFNANSYLIITKAMDTFHPALGYESERAALARIRAQTLLVGISSDWLFPASEVKALSERIREAGVSADYAEIISDHGHDGFLAEPHLLAMLIRGVLNG